MTRTPKALGAIALVAAAGLTLAGCGTSNTSSPTTAGQTTAGNSAVNTATGSPTSKWDPCTIPDSSIAALGLDTTTKSNQVAGTEFPGWNVCSWQATSKTYDFTVFSSGHTLDDIRQRTDRQDFTPATVGSHTALQYRPVGASHNDVCYISAEIPNGLADFSVQERYGIAPTGADPCAEVKRLIETLAQYLPRS